MEGERECEGEGMGGRAEREGGRERGERLQARVTSR